MLLKVTQGGGIDRPNEYLPESAAARIVEDEILRLDKHIIELRVGELQRLLAEADDRDDHGECKRILAEQGALMEALKALASPQVRPMATRRQIATQIEKVVDAISTLPSPSVRVAEPAATGVGVVVAEEETAPSVDHGSPPDDEGPAPVTPLAPLSPLADAPWAGDPDDDPWAV